MHSNSASRPGASAALGRLAHGGTERRRQPLLPAAESGLPLPRGEEMPLICSAPFLTPPLLCRGGESAGEPPLAAEVCFMSGRSSFKETDDSSGPRGGRRPRGVFPPLRRSPAPRARPAQASAGMRALATCAAASRPSSSKAAAASGRAGASERAKGVLLPAQGQRCGLRRVRRSPPRLH